MYICQYSPKDLIYTESLNRVLSTQLNSIDILKFRFTGGDSACYLSLVLPEIVTGSITFKFYVLMFGTSIRFDIEVDDATNNSENYASDYINESVFINRVSTGRLTDASLTNHVATVTKVFTGLGHKNPSDRCIFRITNTGGIAALAGILLEVN